jgi:TonB family protein
MSGRKERVTMDRGDKSVAAGSEMRPSAGTPEVRAARPSGWFPVARAIGLSVALHLLALAALLVAVLSAPRPLRFIEVELVAPPSTAPAVVPGAPAGGPPAPAAPKRGVPAGAVRPPAVSTPVAAPAAPASTAPASLPPPAAGALPAASRDAPAAIPPVPAPVARAAVPEPAGTTTAAPGVPATGPGHAAGTAVPASPGSRASGPPGGRGDGTAGGPANGAASGSGDGTGNGLHVAGVPGALRDTGPAGPGDGSGRVARATRLLRERIQSRVAYPAESIRQEEEGEVLLRVLVGEGGAPREIRLYRSSGIRRLDEAARKGVAGAVPLPSSPGWYEVPVRFSLR